MLQIDHVHFYVENAHRWRDWFVNNLGFQQVPHRGTFFDLINHQKLRDTDTQVVRSGNVCFLISSPLLETSPVTNFLCHHPPGVADVAFLVEDIETVIARVISHGGILLKPIQKTQFGKCCQIKGWGNLTHSLIESTRRLIIHQDSFLDVDHVVLNVESGDLATAATWYENILEFKPQQSFNIHTGISGLNSQVMISGNGKVKLPINQPTSNNSQIQEFLHFNRGSGVQHIALSTTNIVQAIARFRAAGVTFLSIPQSYYSQLDQRFQSVLSPSEFQAIAQQEILIDSQGSTNGLLLQIFTQPIFNEPTFFLEFIERRSHPSGFGEGNFRALFTAMENEQIKRGFVSS